MRDLDLVRSRRRRLPNHRQVGRRALPQVQHGRLWHVLLPDSGRKGDLKPRRGDACASRALLELRRARADALEHLDPHLAIKNPTRVAVARGWCASAVLHRRNDEADMAANPHPGNSSDWSELQPETHALGQVQRLRGADARREPPSARLRQLHLLDLIGQLGAQVDAQPGRL